jgi:hypothetical protein
MVFRAEKINNPANSNGESWSLQICDNSGFPISSAFISPLRVDRIVSIPEQERFFLSDEDASVGRSSIFRFYSCSDYTIKEENSQTLISFHS